MTRSPEVPRERGRPSHPPTRRILAACAVVILAAAAGAVAVVSNAGPPERAAVPLPVETVRVQEVTAHSRPVTLTGRLAAARRSAVGFERQGLLVEVLVDDGAAVRQGEVMARLDSEPLALRRRELEARRRSLRARLELARRTAERQQRLARQGHASEQRYDEARLEADALAAEVQELAAAIDRIELDIAKSALKAPFDGTVERRHVDEGAVVSPGQPIATLVERDRREARVGVPARLARALTPGERYPLVLDGRSVEGRLAALTPELAPETRTLTAVFTLPEAPELGTVGELLRLRLEEQVPGRGYWLPRGALSEDIRGLWSVLALAPAANGKGHVLQRESVEVVEIAGDRVFATGTLQDGQRIVSANTGRVVPGQRVVPAPEPPAPETARR